jgi:hypothetical protein
MRRNDLYRMERQCRSMADGATPEVREILEEMASSFKAKALASPTRVERLLSFANRQQELTIIAIALVIFAIYLPVALWIGRDFVLEPRPEGTVETIAGIQHFGGFAYSTPAYATGRYANDDPAHSPIIIYENLTPLGHAQSVEMDVKNIGLGRFLHVNREGSVSYIFSTSDNSDPRTNGRHYWAVLPK